MTNEVRFIPVNAQEHDNVVRTIVVAHMQRAGDYGGNPTQWVVTAAHEAYQKGFAAGFAAAQAQKFEQQRSGWKAAPAMQQVVQALPPAIKRIPPARLTDADDDIIDV